MRARPYIGLISGTSRDGVDAVVVRFPAERPEIIGSLCLPYPPELAQDLDDLVRAGTRPGEAVCRSLDERIAGHFSQAVLSLLENAPADCRDVAAIGSHGQTVWHEPTGDNPVSMQLGAPGRIASRTGIVTVGDFRRADIEAGGQGAPLAPLLHRALFRPAAGTRVVLNLGGIANISVITAEGGVSGFDTGPANCLLDAWVRLQRGENFDRGGAWAAGGRIDSSLLERLLADEYFRAPAPKSTGIEYFNLSWLEQKGAASVTSARAVQSTLAELTAITVANAILPFEPADVLICGGGIHNSDLVSRLENRLPATPVRSSSDYGLDPDWVEAVLFAWLARERIAGRQQDTRGITGAREPVLLGRITEP